MMDLGTLILKLSPRCAQTFSGDSTFLEKFPTSLIAVTLPSDTDYSERINIPVYLDDVLIFLESGVREANSGKCVLDFQGISRRLVCIYGSNNYTFDMFEVENLPHTTVLISHFAVSISADYAVYNSQPVMSLHYQGKEWLAPWDSMSRSVLWHGDSPIYAIFTTRDIVYDGEKEYILIRDYNSKNATVTFQSHVKMVFVVVVGNVQSTLSICGNVEWCYVIGSHDLRPLSVNITGRWIFLLNNGLQSVQTLYMESVVRHLIHAISLGAVTAPFFIF